MAFTAGLTGGLTEPITKTLLEDYFYGKLTLEEMVAALGSTLWLDATETYAKSKVAVDLVNTIAAAQVDYLYTTSLNISSSEITIHICAKSDNWSSGTTQFLFTLNDGTTNNKIEIYNAGAGGQLNLRTSFNGSDVHLQGTHSLSGFNFITAVIRENSTNGIQLYVNGVELSYNTVDDRDSTGLSFSSTLTTAYIGGSNITTNRPLDGNIDQTTVFNKALTTTELATILNSGNGLQHKDLDGTESFYGNIVAWYDFNTPPNFGRNYAEESHAVRLSSASDKLTSSSTDFNKQPSDAFSWGYWLKVDSIVGMFPFFFQKDNGVTGYEIYFDGSISSIDVDFKDDAGGRVRHSYSSVFTAGQWVHFVVTYSGNGQSSGLKLYLNGVEQTPVVNNNVTMTGSFDNSTDFTLFIGDIDTTVDEAFFYSDELISGEVTTLYNGGTVAPARTLHTDNLVSDWSFNAQNVTDIGKDSYGSNDLTPVSIVEADLVGGKDSLDLTEVSISSANATLGHIEGKAAGYDGVTLLTGRSGGVNAQQLTITEIATWYTDNYIRFTGSDNLDTTANIDLSGDFTIVMRSKHSNIAESSDLLSTSTTIYNNNTSGLGVCLGVTSTNPIGEDVWNTVVIKSESGTISFRLNGVANGSGSRDATVVTSTTMTIGDTTLTQNWDLRGLLIKESALTEAEIQTVESYFLTLATETDWTPAEITTSAWLDASDSSTITESGGSVSQWDDKSGNGLNVTQGTGSYQPVLGTNEIQFDGVDDNLFASGSDFPYGASGAYTAFIVFRSAVSQTNDSIGLITGNGNSSTANPLICVVANSSFRTYVDGTLSSSAWSADNTRYIGASRFDGAEHETFIDGTSGGTTTATQGASGTFYIGGVGGSGTRFFEGAISEMLIFNNAISLSNRQTVEGYLAHKWGLAANLDAAHPYKLTPPKI